jgi:GDP-4-dehydro-6-deoxy-D-mannose reductase
MSDLVWREIQAILNELISLSPARIRAEVDPSRIRPADAPILVGDRSCLSRDTGWEPEIPFTKTLGDVLQYWRERI